MERAASPGLVPPAPSDNRYEDSTDDEINDDVFDDSGDEQEAINSAHIVAESVLAMLREQFGEDVRHWIYPFGTVAITTDADHSEGLGLDPSPKAADSFTVLRGYGDGAYDVTMFKRQSRTTLVGFPHDADADDQFVGLRARALLLSDIEWCEASDSSEDLSEDEYVSRAAGLAPLSAAGTRLQIRKLSPSTQRPPNATTSLPAAAGREQNGNRPPPPKERWASAPELDQLVGELIGTRDQVLSALKLQDAYRACRRTGRIS